MTDSQWEEILAPIQWHLSLLQSVSTGDDQAKWDALLTSDRQRPKSPMPKSPLTRLKPTLADAFTGAGNARHELRLTQFVGYLDNELTRDNAPNGAEGRQVNQILATFARSTPESLDQPQKWRSWALFMASKAYSMTEQAINVDGGMMMV
jgi:hypothetical protein